jgi:hypothetical protein
MFADVTVITLNGLHKTLLCLTFGLAFVVWLFWKFDGKSKSRRQRPQNKAAKKKRAGVQVRRALKPALKSKENNPHPHSLNDIR